jgi:hypothetical protein
LYFEAAITINTTTITKAINITISLYLLRLKIANLILNHEVYTRTR